MCILYSAVRQPAPAPEQAILTLIGFVRAPRLLSLTELHALPKTSRRLTLVCARVSPRPERWDTRLWTGVPMAALLDAAGVPADAQSIEVAGYDGATAVFPLADLGDALLALEVDGRPLNAKEGFPARLLIPGQPACAMPRFVQRITFRGDAAPALATPSPLAIITGLDSVDGGVRVSGRALGTDTVLLSLDDGPPVRVTVHAATVGVAADWSLDWPGVRTRQVAFTVQALPDWGHKADRPLARRWKPDSHMWQATR